MSLYDDIVVDKNTKESDKTTGWSSSAGIKLLQDHLQTKKVAQHQHKRDLRKPTHSIASSFGLTTKVIRDEMPPPPVIAGGHQGKGLLGGDWDHDKEYDPLWPNDYEKIMKERQAQSEREKEAQRLKEMEERQKRKKERFEMSNSRGLGLDYGDDDSEEDEEDKKKYSRPTGAAIAPPTSLLSESAIVKPNEKEQPSFTGVSSVAAKIMAKMGYKEGQGLGRDEQGMSTALQVEQSCKGVGKIIHEKDSLMPPPPPPLFSSVPPPTSQQQQDIESITEIMKNPSKVVLLRNMVGRGEVDDDLEPETKEECSKYGEVIKCIIFELTGDNIADEDAVRIFIEFKRVESAIKAVVDLNGRYFGGRIVKATFYDVEKFKRLELKD